MKHIAEMTDREVIVLRLTHPTAVVCSVCEGNEFRINRGEPDMIECLRCGRSEPFTPIENPKKLKADDAKMGRALIHLEDAISELESAREDLES